jgi:hypothetical protein
MPSKGRWCDANDLDRRDGAVALEIRVPCSGTSAAREGSYLGAFLGWVDWTKALP